MLRARLEIECANAEERLELLKMLERRGYRWQAGEKPTEYNGNPGYMFFYINRGKRLTHGPSELAGRTQIPFQEVKDALTSNRQAQRTSS